ncbi:MAG: tetratricopeptide repeat protein [Desulfobacteraceae bacterium]|nr:MAG: tetratricopeptide repeat protein [Desulfobacteraceae bacterium]
MRTPLSMNHMNTLACRLSVLLMLIAVFMSGCSQTLKHEPEPQTTRLAPKPVVVDTAPSSYYYYLESRLHAGEKQWSQAIASIKNAIKADPESIYLKIERITLYLKIKKLDKALSAAEQLVLDHPNSVDCLEILAKLKSRTEDKAGMEDIYSRVLALDPENKDAFLALGTMFMEAEEYDDALDLFTRMKASFPNYYVVHYYLGKIHQARNRLDPAREALERALELEPDLVEPRFDLTDIYMAQMSDPPTEVEKQRIIDAYDKILSIDRENMRARLELPLFYHKHGDLNAAEEMFADLGEMVDSEQTLLMTLTSVFISDERFEDASIILTGLLKGVPDHSRLHYLAGLAFEAIKDFPEALHHYLMVKPDSLHYKKTLVLIAFIYQDMNRTQEAIEWLEAQHGNFPKDVDIITYLGYFYEEEKRYEDALAILTKGLELSPDSSSLMFRFGVVQDKAGNKDECIAAMKKVIELDPKNATALNYLGYTYADLGIELDAAQNLIQRALEIKPDDGYIVDSLGWTFFKKGRFEQAAQTLEKAARLTEFDATIVEHLGDTYAELKQYSKAIETYQKAILQLKENIESKTREINAKIESLQQKLNETQ